MTNFKHGSRQAGRGPGANLNSAATRCSGSFEDTGLHEVAMTGMRQNAFSADEDSFVGTYFDQALRLREMESAKANHLTHDSIPFPAGSPHAELPPQEADNAGS